MVGAGADRVLPAQLPFDLSIMLVARFRALPEESGEHQVSCQVHGPQMDQILEASVSVEFGSAEGTEPSWEVGAICPFWLNLQLVESGAYTVTLKPDEGKPLSLALYVLEPPEADPDE